MREKQIYKERLDQIFEFTYDGFYLTDGDANTIRINEAYERITGLQRREMIGKNMRTLIREGYISESGSLKVLEKGETVTLYQEFKTGKKALITSKPLFDENGRVDLVVTNVRDITELYHLQEALAEKEALAKTYYEEINALKAQIVDTEGFTTTDKDMLDLLYKTQKVAATDIPVLLIGESGVGKELFSKFVHKNSPRKHAPFIKINCGAIPDHLIESEFFGYVKGAFTGANSNGKAGVFEIADGGTLFLDEVGELPLAMQVKLLRVLQEGEFMRLGDTKIRHVDVRVVSATNRNLEDMIENKTFREDLFYRLNVAPIQIPPLRVRPSDILALSHLFVRNINAKYQWKKQLSSEVMAIFYAYEWPGNVRELKNIIERICVMSSEDMIVCQDVPDKIRKAVGNTDCGLSVRIGGQTLKAATIALETEMIEAAYQKYGNVRQAAHALGIDASTLVRKRQRYQENGVC